MSINLNQNIGSVDVDVSPRESKKENIKNEINTRKNKVLNNKKIMEKSLRNYLLRVKRSKSTPISFFSNNYSDEILNSDVSIMTENDDIKNTEKNNNNKIKNINRSILNKSVKKEKEFITYATRSKNEEEGREGRDLELTRDLLNLYKLSGNCMKLKVNGILVPEYMVKRFSLPISSSPSPLLFRSINNNNNNSNNNINDNDKNNNKNENGNIDNEYGENGNENGNGNGSEKKENKFVNYGIQTGSFFLESCWALCE